MTIVKSWPKGAGQEIRVSLDTYKGKPVISARTWFKDPETGDMRAGRNGLNLPIEHLRPLSKAIRKALKQAEESNLVEKEGAE